MPVVSRKDGVDSVAVDHGTAKKCKTATTQTTDKGSLNVFINGTGVVREGDTMISHKYPSNCYLHAPALSTYSPNVHANGKKIGRKGDLYTTGHELKTGSPNVFANGS